MKCVCVLSAVLLSQSSQLTVNGGAVFGCAASARDSARCSVLVALAVNCQLLTHARHSSLNSTTYNVVRVRGSHVPYKIAWNCALFGFLHSA
jgi:hypothetical protein